MKIKFKKILSIALCIAVIFMIGYVIPVYASEESEDFCKILNESGRDSFRINDKFSLSADYYSDDENATLLWTIEGESVFRDGESEKTETGSIVFIHFLGDTNIKLQLISQDGKVLAEDEITIKTMPEKNFFEKAYDKLVGAFLTFWIVVIGGVGGTIGSLFGGFFN